MCTPKNFKYVLLVMSIYASYAILTAQADAQRRIREIRQLDDDRKALDERRGFDGLYLRENDRRNDIERLATDRRQSETDKDAIESLRFFPNRRKISSQQVLPMESGTHRTVENSRQEKLGTNDVTKRSESREGRRTFDVAGRENYRTLITDFQSRASAKDSRMMRDDPERSSGPFHENDRREIHPMVRNSEEREMDRTDNIRRESESTRREETREPLADRRIYARETSVRFEGSQVDAARISDRRTEGLTQENHEDRQVPIRKDREERRENLESARENRSRLLNRIERREFLGRTRSMDTPTDSSSPTESGIDMSHLLGLLSAIAMVYTNKQSLNKLTSFTSKLAIF